MTIRLALDWIPDNLHTGVLTALSKGFYSQYGLTVSASIGTTRHKSLLPLQQVADQSADIAFVSSNTLIRYLLQPGSTPLTAISAIMQDDICALATLKTSGINRPGLLDGKIYASNHCPLEDALARQLVHRDGGKGNLLCASSTYLDPWEALLHKKADAAWIYLPREGTEARLRDIDLNIFRLTDFDIPAGYAPVMVALAEASLQQQEAIALFMKATDQGFSYAYQHPDEAPHLLAEGARNWVTPNLPQLSTSYSNYRYALVNGEGRWGLMQPAQWAQYIEWLCLSGILTNAQAEKVTDHLSEYENLYSNAWLETI
jgi:ABC-type nitrate/sulfonate/bicarbonate transport system substrate-binding protein